MKQDTDGAAAQTGVPTAERAALVQQFVEVFLWPDAAEVIARAPGLRSRTGMLLAVEHLSHVEPAQRPTEALRLARRIVEVLA